MANKYLAVYGSLRRGQRAEHMMNVPALSYVGTDRIPAKLYALGWYPGIELTTDREHTTVVDVYEVIDENGLQHLHNYEGYYKDNPVGSLFILRNNVPLLDSNKEAMCYEYNFGRHSNVRPDHLIVEHGDWTRYLSERDSRNVA